MSPSTIALLLPVDLRKRRAVSNVLTAILLLIIAIVAVGAGIVMMKQQTESLTRITSIDAGQSRLYVNPNPTTGEGSLTLVFMNTGTTTVTIQAGRIGQQGLANITFVNPVQIKYENATGKVVTVNATSVTTSDPARSGVTSQGLVLASQTSATIQFTGLSGISASIPSNNEYAVTMYTTGAEVFTFKIVAETSGENNGQTTTTTTTTSYTVTFYIDPTYGTVTADGASKMNGTTVTYLSGQRVHVVAHPLSGYSFASWEAGGVFVDNAVSTDTYMTVSNNGWLKAHFAVAQYTITVLTRKTDGSALSGIQVSLDDENETTGPSGSVQFSVPAGTYSLSVQSSLSGGTGVRYNFTQWTGDGTANPKSITVSSSATYDARYKIQYQLTVTSAHDSPTQTPAGSSGWYDSGISITASVISPASGDTGIQYASAGWTGTGSVPSSGSGTSVTFTITAASTITWNWKTQYQLTMQTDPSGVGTVSPSVGTYWYDSGSSVTISATAGSGYVFSSWSGSGSSSYTGTQNSHGLTMNSPVSETANFQQIFQITITSNPTGSGFVSIDSTGIATPQTFAWVLGSTHTLTAISPVDCGSECRYVWVSWSDGGSQSHTITASASTTLSATFKMQYYLTVVSPHDSPSPSSNWFDGGSSVSASVSSPVSGGTDIQYVCTGWTGSGSVPATGSFCSTSFVIDAPSSITWSWKTQYYLTMQVYPDGSAGTVSPLAPGQWQDEHSLLTISAAANPNYQFWGWTGSGLGSNSSANSPAQITMNAPITEIADFATVMTTTQVLTSTGTTTVTSYTTTTETTSTSYTSTTTSMSTIYETTTTTTTITYSSSPPAPAPPAPGPLSYFGFTSLFAVTFGRVMVRKGSKLLKSRLLMRGNHRHNHNELESLSHLGV